MKYINLILFALFLCMACKKASLPEKAPLLKKKQTLETLEGKWVASDTICKIDVGELTITVNDVLLAYPKGKVTIIDKNLAELKHPSGETEKFYYSLKDEQLTIGFRSGAATMTRMDE